MVSASGSVFSVPIVLIHSEKAAPSVASHNSQQGLRPLTKKNDFQIIRPSSYRDFGSFGSSQKIKEY